MNVEEHFETLQELSKLLTEFESADEDRKQQIKIGVLEAHKKITLNTLEISSIKIVPIKENVWFRVYECYDEIFYQIVTQEVHDGIIAHITHKNIEFPNYQKYSDEEIVNRINNIMAFL